MVRDDDDCNSNNIKEAAGPPNLLCLKGCAVHVQIKMKNLNVGVSGSRRGLEASNQHLELGQQMDQAHRLPGHSLPHYAKMWCISIEVTLIFFLNLHLY